MQFVLPSQSPRAPARSQSPSFLAVMMSDSPHSNMTEAKALLIITCIVAVPFVVTWFATKFVFKMLAREMRREE